ncbi:MAG: molybdopterin-dependent oxidoreductase [Planctomycetota bacterium]
MSEIRRTACNRDCPDSCSLLVEVEGDRVLAIRGDPEDPFTRGFICPRTRRFPARHHAPDRFLRPQVRRDGRLEPLSWDAALDLAADRLATIRDRDGGAAVLHYRSAGSLGVLRSVSDLFFARFGPVTRKRGDICMGAGEAAQFADFGAAESGDPDDLAHAGVIVLWGKNPNVSSVHLLPGLRAARERGIPVVAIDPVRSAAARGADLHLQPRPGADYAIAMAVVRGLFARDAVDPDAAARCLDVAAFRALAEARDHRGWAAEADLDPERLEALVELIATRRPLNLQIGWGLQRRRNGGRTMRALDGLAALAGSVGVRGGGANFYCATRAGAFDSGFGAPPPPAARTLAEARLGPEILAARDPGIAAIWVTAGNPVSMLPEAETVRRAFASREFVVVVDTHPTDTTDLADLVLPTLTLLEDEDLLGAYGNHFLRASRPVLPPAGEARHELEIYAALAERLGFGDEFPASPTHWKARAAARLAGREAELERGLRSPFAARVPFEDGRFATPSGRIELLTERAAPPRAADPDYPMTLLALSTAEAQSSQWSVDPGEGPPELRIHPDRAAGRTDGARARLESRHGAMDVVLRLDPELRRDVALTRKGGMFRRGGCANALIAAEETDLGGGAVYYDEPVRLV